jgi:antitoxin YefM
MQITHFTKAQSNLKSVLDHAVDNADYIVIKRSDAGGMSLDSFNSLMETVHLFKSPANLTHLMKSIAQYKHIS